MADETETTALNEAATSPTATQETPANTDVTPAESSTATTDVKEPSLQETLVALKEKSASDANSEVLKENPTEEAEATTTTKEEPVVEETQPGKAVPYDRFKKINDERNSYLKEKETFQQELEQAKPYIERAKNLDSFCQQNNIQTSDLQSSLEIASLINNGNHAAALEKLTPIYNALQESAGHKLPEDLQKQVAEGLLTEAAAKQMATLRREKTSLEAQQKRSGDYHRQQQQVQLEQTLVAWFTNKQKMDPDFKQGNEKHSLVVDRFNRLWTTVPVNTFAEAAALLDRAYSEIDSSIKQFKPQPTARQVKLTSNGSSTTKAKEVVDTTKKGWQKAVAQQVAHRHGLGK